MNEFILIVAGAVIATVIGGLFIYNAVPHYTYQPVNACELFTPDEAHDLLGDKMVGVDTNKPVVTKNTATSKCSYTNGIIENMIVAAVAVRSAVHEPGIQQNKKDFAAAKSNNDVKDVKGLGDSAYFNRTNGQLNILKDRSWILISYGVGEKPGENKLEDAIKLARKVLD